MISHPQQPKTKAHSFYYWELIVYFRKILLCILVILGRSLEQSIQLNLLLALFAAFALMQIKSRPYLEPKANRLELVSLIVGLCIVYIRLVMLSQIQQEKNKQQTFNMFSGV